MENYVGKRLDGRYEIIEIIGVGGMAVVYKAFDNIDNRIVAVKILKDEYLTNEEFRRRFKNESKAIAVLSHPNIVKVFDVSYGDRLQYIVMEYVEGITLKEYISQQGTIEIREAIYFVTQILRALQHAHDKGIVHRDIKPQNIMLIADGTIKVTDFGIARFARSDTKTMTDSAIGSVHYISPEQAKGSVMDAKTDIYSVGVVLYEMLTGKLPFQSENAVSVALMQLQSEPEKPRNINPDIPVGLEQIVMRAMQKNPNDRYQSASEMLMDIDEYKKNPNIKFDYSYYVDRQPTKYIPSAQEIAREYQKQVSRPAQQPTQPPRAPRQNRSEQEKKAAAARKRTLVVLASLLAALAIFAAVLVHLYAKSGNRVDVPYLVGKNLQAEVLGQEAYEDFELVYEYDEDIDEFTIRYVNPAIMDLYGYFTEKNTVKKVEVSGRDAVHFHTYDRHDEKNNSKLWFSAGEEFYYIAWRGTKITPEIKEVVKSASDSKYTHDEFYDILNDEYQNYKIVHAIENQRNDYPRSDSGHHSFVSVGSNGVNFGVMT